MTRVTKKQLRATLCLFARALDRELADNTYYKVGSLYLTYEQYVGWKICEVMENRGEAHPFGDVGRTASQLYDLMWFGMRTLSETAEYKEKEAKQIEEILNLIGI